LGFRYLFTSHLLFHDVFALLCTLISLGHSEIVPHIGKDIVLFHAVAVVVQSPEDELGIGIPLLGS